jgi:hypothetical protein
MADRSLPLPLVYNTNLIDETQIPARLIARQGELTQLLEDLVESSGTHHLILGTAGMGRSLLLRAVIRRLRSDARWRQRWTPLWIERPLASLAHPCELWVALLEHLADSLAEGGDTHAAASIHAVVSALPEQDDQRADAALWSLGAWASRQRSLLLCFDDVELLSPALIEALAGVLRHPELVVLATSAGLPSASLDSFRALLAPRSHRLEALGLAQARDLLGQLAEASGHPAIGALLERQPARTRAVHALVGGSPRAIVQLHRVLALEPELSAPELVVRVLDLASPIHQARLQALAPQSRQVALALARAWDPCSAADVARACRMHVNKASSQLARLQKAGVVRKLALHGNPRAGFTLADRELALWCLLQAGARSRARVEQLVEFLERLWSPEQRSRPAPPRRVSRPAPTKSLSMFGSRRRRVGAFDHAGMLSGAPSLGSPELSEPESPSEGGFDEASREQALLSLQAAVPGSSSGATPCWATCAMALRQLVAAGQVSEALAVLEQPGTRGRWRPVEEALRAIRAGDERHLLDVAPELREPAREILQSLGGVVPRG